jgi:hypothetical protein
VRAERDGQLVVGVDRVFARRFYTDVPLQSVQEHTGEAPYMEKALVWGAFLGGPLLLVGSSVLLVFALKWWWSVLAIPLSGLVWVAYYSMSSRGDARLRLVSLVVVAVAVCGLATTRETRLLWLAAIIYAIALWLGRFVYVGSTTLLRAFVLRNSRAFEWLRGNLILRPAR